MGKPRGLCPAPVRAPPPLSDFQVEALEWDYCRATFVASCLPPSILQSNRPDHVCYMPPHTLTIMRGVASPLVWKKHTISKLRAPSGRTARPVLPTDATRGLEYRVRPPVGKREMK